MKSDERGFMSIQNIIFAFITLLIFFKLLPLFTPYIVNGSNYLSEQGFPEAALMARLIPLIMLLLILGGIYKVAQPIIYRLRGGNEEEEEEEWP